MTETLNTGFMLPYKQAKVYNGEKEWFVSFHWYSITYKKYIRKKVRIHAKGLSELERERRLNEVCKKLNVVIKERNSKNIYHEQVVSNKELKTFIEYLKHYSEQEGLALSTRRTLTSCYNSYTLFLEANPIFKTQYPDTIIHNAIPEYVQFLQAQNKVGKTVNMYVWAIQFVLDRLHEEKLLMMPVKVESLRVKAVKNSTGKYRPLTHKEKETVFNHLRHHNKDFYIYVLSIYYTCIRPGELKRLKVGSVNLAAGKIHVPWYSAKNGLSNFVQILTPLAAALEDYNLNKVNKNFFWFGSNFAPSPEEYKGKNASDKWRTMCNKLNIDESAMMYGMKHTFNVDYVENNRNNIDWEWLRCHNRHATIQQTQDYIRTLTPYMLDETKSKILNYHKSASVGQM